MSNISCATFEPNRFQPKKCRECLRPKTEHRESAELPRSVSVDLFPGSQPTLQRTSPHTKRSPPPRPPVRSSAGIPATPQDRSRTITPSSQPISGRDPPPSLFPVHSNPLPIPNNSSLFHPATLENLQQTAPEIPQRKTTLIVKGPSLPPTTPWKADVLEQTSPLLPQTLVPELEALTLDAWLRRKSIVLSPTQAQSDVSIPVPFLHSIPSPPRPKSADLTPAPVSSISGSSTGPTSRKASDAIPNFVPPATLPVPTVPNPKNWTAEEQEVWRRIKARAPQHRLMEYFLIVGRGTLLSALNGRQGIEGLVYSARLEDRYPKHDWPGAELEEDAIPIFAFPQNIQLVVTRGEKELKTASGSLYAPQCFRLTMTRADGARQYCSVLRFWEKMDLREVLALVDEKIAKYQEDLMKAVDEGDVERIAYLRDARDRMQLERLRVLLELSLSQNDLEGCVALREKRKEIMAALGINADAILDTDTTTFWTPKALCCVSQYTFLNLLEMFVKSIYRVSRSPAPMPIERYIANLFFEVPVPPRGQLRVRYSLGECSTTFARAPPNKMPLSHSSFRLLFRILDVHTIIFIHTAMMTEEKVVFCSSSLAVLSHISEAFIQLLFPFQWAGVYVPILPVALADILCSPTPLIAGLHSSFRETMDQPSEVVFVDLDRNEVFVPTKDSVVPLPVAEHRTLLKALERSAKMYDPSSKAALLASLDVAFPKDEHTVPMQMWDHPSATKADPQDPKDGHCAYMNSINTLLEEDADFSASEVRCSFLHLWVNLLGKYRDFRAVNSIGDDGFDRKRFLDKAPSNARKLLGRLLNTQLFALFIQDCYGQPLPGHVLFFDAAIVGKQKPSLLFRKKTKKDTSFIGGECAEFKTTVECMKPNREGIGSACTFTYPHFPELDEHRFLPLRLQEPLADTSNSASGTLHTMDAQQSLLAGLKEPPLAYRSERRGSIHALPPSSPFLMNRLERRGSVKWEPSVFLETRGDTPIVKY